MIDRRTNRVATALLLLAAIMLLPGCKPAANQVPELQGGDAVDARPAVEGFALVTAGRGRHDGEVAIELALLALMIVALVASLVLLRRHPARQIAKRE